MVNPTAISWAHYGWETSFGAVTTASDKTFGQGVKISTLSRKNNIEKIYTLGSRNAVVLQPMVFEGAVGIDFVMANPWFFKAVMGSASVTGVGPYTHTYAEADTVPSFTIENNISTDTKSVAKLLGCLVNNCTISTSVGKAVEVKLDCIYSTETHGSTTSAQVSETFDIFTFAHGTVEIPNGTTIADVESIDLTIANKIKPIMGLGSRFSQNAVPEEREYTGKLVVPYEQLTNTLQKLYGGATGPIASPAETATMELVFDNGSTGTAQRQISLVYTGVQFDDHDLAQDPAKVINEGVGINMRSLSVTSINNTSVTP